MFPLQTKCPYCSTEETRLYRTQKGVNKAKAADRMVLCNKCKASLAGKSPRKSRGPVKSITDKALELPPEERELMAVRLYQSLYKSILAKALKLSPEERESMIQALVASLPA